jgi:CBS domain-containing protein
VLQMQVRDGMSKVILSIGPAHTLREAASLMTKRKVGSAVVLDSDRSGIGILTERDILDAIGMGQNPDTELAAAHLTGDLVFATPTWTLEQAAEAMTRGGFRHLIVIDQNEVVGMISVRDIVRCWVEQASPSGQLVG